MPSFWQTHHLEDYTSCLDLIQNDEYLHCVHGNTISPAMEATDVCVLSSEVRKCWLIRAWKSNSTSAQGNNFLVLWNEPVIAAAAAAAFCRSYLWEPRKAGRTSLCMPHPEHFSKHSDTFCVFSRCGVFVRGSASVTRGVTAREKLTESENEPRFRHSEKCPHGN